MLFFVLVGVLLVVGFILYGVWRGTRRRALPASAAKRLRTAFDAARVVGDPRLRVMEAEKVLDAALKELGYRGTFADKLRTAGPRFGNTQPIWDAHKLRNAIAHDVGVAVSEREAGNAVLTFQRALERLC